MTAKSKILEYSNNLRCPLTCVPEFGASTKPAPSGRLNLKSNIDDSDRNRRKTADTVLPNKRNIYKDLGRRTGSIIPGITRFTVVLGSHDLSCPKQQTIYPEITRLVVYKPLVWSKHERVCLHSPEYTQRDGRMEGARNGSTGTGVGVLTFDKRHLCEIELPPLTPPKWNSSISSLPCR